MATCFLFIEHLDAEGCFCLRLDALDEVDAPLQKRSPDDIRVIQENARTIVVIPTAAAGLHVFNLPWLGERKAREAIPYALEEQVAQPVTELHFAFDKAHYQQGSYLIAVIDKQRLLDWMGLLDELELDFDQATLDWFALAPGEVCVKETSVLIHHDEFKGALSPELAQSYLNQSSNQQGFLFDESAPGVRSPDFVSMEGASTLFIAKRLAQASFINLCQGEGRHDMARETSARWYHASAILLGVWLCSLLGMNALNLSRLSTEHNLLDTQIAVIYRVFFPHSTDVISPQFRIEQALKTDAAGHQGAFWYLLGQLVASYKASDRLTIDQLHFQNQTLFVSLTTEDFATLEAFEHRLKQAKLQVTQTQAASHDKQVVAMLELRG